MKVKTYKIYLPDLDIAYKHDEIQEFQKKLDDLLKERKSCIVLDPVFFVDKQQPQYVVVVYALEKTFEKNRETINKIEAYIRKEGIRYYEYEDVIHWNEERIWREIKRDC